MHIPVASHPNFGTGTSEQPDPQGSATLVLAGKASSARRGCSLGASCPWKGGVMQRSRGAGGIGKQQRGFQGRGLSDHS